MSRERPILFSGPMVRAILDGRKTQTRRVVKFPRPILDIEGGVMLTAFDRMQDGYKDGPRPVFDFDGEPNSFSVRNPYGQPGDRLWVRETLTRSGGFIQYAADHKTSRTPWPVPEWKQDPRPSIHMPRWASRLTLEITDVSVERLQDITNDDARAEGCEGGPHVEGYSDANPADPYEEFGVLWDSINEARGYGWNANPWVWVISFRLPENAHV